MSLRHLFSRENLDTVPASFAFSLGLLVFALSWPGASRAGEAFVPGEIIVKYKRPVAVEGADVDAAAEAAGRAGKGVRARGVSHDSPSLANLDRKFGLLKAEHPRERRGARDTKLKDEVRAGAGAGTLIPTIPAGVCQDPGGNWNEASQSDDNTVTYLGSESQPSNAGHWVLY